MSKATGAGSSRANAQPAGEPDSTSEFSRQARTYESRAQAAQAAEAAQEAQAARRAAARRAAVQRATAERAAEQPRAPQPSAPPTADAQPKTSQPKTAPQAAPSGSPQQIAAAMLASFGWSSSEFGCLNELWVRESGWNPAATNPYSGAYGIPQALPGAKMASAGADWETNPATQIRWGLGYIKATYGSPCAAWSHETSYGWY
ncbi:MAG TPA: lytic transglycosylase domain-containing protein [Streptosporangiaceae bacterium]|nr:lytic transglycosylase domain-containing protein [Streptosporangiaceae bacterium]